MASPISHEKTYESPEQFFDMEDDYAPDMLGYNHHQDFNNPFKLNSKMNQAIDPILSNNHMNAFSFDTNFWNDPSQLAVLETINPTQSPLGGNQSYDTGYASRSGSSSSKSPPAGLFQSRDDMMSKQANSISKPRKRSSTKSTTTTKSADPKPARKARRTSKAVSIVEPLDDEEDETKREQFLARNREAASKCRQKKKEWTTDLEQKARDLSAQKQMLTTYLAMLKNELLMLKCKCLEHSDCDCTAIRSYMTNTLSSMPPANAALYSKLESKNAGEIEDEIARKQSSASMFDMSNVGSPNEMVTSPSSAGGDVSADLLHFEAELQAAVKD